MLKINLISKSRPTTSKEINIGSTWSWTGVTSSYSTSFLPSTRAKQTKAWKRKSSLEGPLLFLAGFTSLQIWSLKDSPFRFTEPKSTIRIISMIKRSLMSLPSTNSTLKTQKKQGFQEKPYKRKTHGPSPNNHPKPNKLLKLKAHRSKFPSKKYFDCVYYFLKSNMLVFSNKKIKFHKKVYLALIYFAFTF